MNALLAARTNRARRPPLQVIPTFIRIFLSLHDCTDTRTATLDAAAMQFRHALITSALTHTGVLGLLWIWPPIAAQQAEFSVTRGQPLTIQLVVPSRAERAMQVEVSREPLLEPPPSDPLEPTPTRWEELRPESPPPVAERPSELSGPAETSLPAPAAADRPPPNDEPREPLLTHAPARSERPTLEVPSSAEVLPLQSPAEAGARVDQLPTKLTNNPPPAYPLDALLARIEGRVMITASILPNGRVGDARVTTSSGAPSLDEAALRAVRQWRFRPAQRAGRSVPFDVLVPVKFSIAAR